MDHLHTMIASLVKLFLETGVQVRHIRNLPPLTFAVDDRYFYSTIEGLEEAKLKKISRGFKDSIGDVEYSQGKMRIDLRANGIPVNIFIDLI